MYKFNMERFLLIVLAFLCTTTLFTIPLMQRMKVEKNAKVYDVVLDYDEMEAMAKQSEYDMRFWLESFRTKIGIYKVALIEENFNSLTENEEIDVQAYTMDDIARRPNWKSNYPEELLKMIRGFDKYDVLVEIRDRKFKNFILEALEKRFEKGQYRLLDMGDVSYVLFDGDSQTALYSQSYKLVDSVKKGVNERIDVIGSKIMFIGLGLNPDKVDVIKSAGCTIIPRTLSYRGFNTVKFAKAVLDGVVKNGASTEYFLSGGEAVLGNDEYTEFINEFIKKEKTKIGFVETTTQRGNIEQDGLTKLVEDWDYRAVRVFSVWNYIQNRYQVYGYSGAEEIENTFFRAILERNIRLIYFKPIKENQDMHTYITNFNEYKELFDNLDARLTKHGFTRGSASVMEGVQITKVSMSFLGLTLITGILLILMTLFRLSTKNVVLLSLVGLFGLYAATYLMPNTYVLLLSFSVAVVAACLAINMYMYNLRHLTVKQRPNAGLGIIVLNAVKILLMSVGIALIGAIITQAPLSNNAFMLEMHIFRGVKLAQLIPLAYFIVAYLAYFGFGSKKEEESKLECRDIQNLLKADVKMWMILVAGLVGAVGAYYMLRTGHESSLEVSGTEMLFRNYLEDHLIARPRNKEFLFAFPAMMVSVYMFFKNLRLPSVILGFLSVVGITSIINTFMHIRTPLYLGFFRTGYSVLFGLILGIIAILGCEAFRRICQKYQKCMRL